MGAWKDKIKPALVALRQKRTGADKLREDYFMGQNVYCKCGNPITKGGRQLAIFTQVEILMNDQTKHLTPCCVVCAPKIIGDSDLAADYYLLDLVQWQDEADRIDAAQQPATAARLSEFMEKSANRKPQ
jgi:hypothetical protein